MFVYIKPKTIFVAYRSSGQNRTASAAPAVCAAAPLFRIPTGDRFMRLIQLLDESGIPSVGAVEANGTQVRLLREVGSTYALANAALAAGLGLDDYATHQLGDIV